MASVSRPGPARRWLTTAAEMKKILAEPDTAKKIAEQGGTVKLGPPEEFKKWFIDSIATWGKVVKDAGIKGE